MKVVFSDFDRTMVDVSKNTLSREQLSILSKLREKGVIFSIVTGRCLSFFRENYSELMNVVSYFILSNGSSIYDVSNKRYIYCNFIDSDDLKKIYECAKRYHLSIYFNLLEGRIHVEKEIYQDFDFDKMACEQVVLSMDSGNFNDLIGNIEQIRGVVISNKGVEPGDGDFFLDINKREVSKGNAISYLYDYLKISKEDAICFGDSDNDMSMFHVVGKRVAVKNASCGIKENADIVIDSVWEDGVFRYIEDVFLKN